MNRIRIRSLSHPAGVLPTMAALPAAVLIPASLCAQPADTPPPAAATPPPDQTAPIAPAASAPANGPIKLTPFEVTSSKDSGYFTPNTTAGTRLNNNIGDIPSSVTVINKQQI